MKNDQKLYIHFRGTYKKNLNLVKKAFVDICRDIANNCINFAFRQFKSVLDVVHDLRQKLINEIASIEISDFNAGDYVKVTVLLMRDNLEKVSKN